MHTNGVHLVQILLQFLGYKLCISISCNLREGTVLYIESSGYDDPLALLEDFPEVCPNQGVSTVPATILVYHGVIITGYQGVSITILPKSVYIGTNRIGGADNVQSTSPPGLGICRIVSIQYTGTSIHPEWAR